MTHNPDPITHNSALHASMQQWRRDIHQHPELAYEELRTADKVANILRETGMEVYTEIGETGVVGVLPGTDPEAIHIGLRADMDALPLKELNTFEHASCHDGKMHACGHDGHTTMLLGAAVWLAKNPHFRGTLYFIFQPAEEGEAGAKRMIEEGLFERFPIQSVYGMHNWPALAAGEFAVHEGAVMASTDSFQIEITGQGGHAAMPDSLIDPVLVAGYMITALQSIISRSLSPVQSGVISVTQMHAGTNFNVVPETAALKGTVRTLNMAQRETILSRMQQVVEHTAKAFGATATVDFEQGFPVTQNDPNHAKECFTVVSQLVGQDKAHWNPPPSMGAEDFSYMLMEKPGAYIWIGNGADTHDKPLHNPHYDFNDGILPLGASYWVRLVQHLSQEA